MFPVFGRAHNLTLLEARAQPGSAASPVHGFGGSVYSPDIRISRAVMHISSVALSAAVLFTLTPTPTETFRESQELLRPSHGQRRTSPISREVTEHSPCSICSTQRQECEAASARHAGSRPDRFRPPYNLPTLTTLLLLASQRLGATWCEMARVWSWCRCS